MSEWTITFLEEITEENVLRYQKEKILAFEEHLNNLKESNQRVGGQLSDDLIMVDWKVKAEKKLLEMSKKEDKQ